MQRRYALAAVVLALALALTTPTSAGIIHSDKTPTPTPTPVAGAQAGETDGIIHSDAAGPEPQTAESAAGITLDLLLTLLTLF